METEKHIKNILKNTENFLEQVIIDNFDAICADAIADVKKEIKGEYDDMVIDFLAPKFLPSFKTALLAKIEEISEEV